MAKGSGIKTSKGTTTAAQSQGPTAQGTLNMIAAHSDNTGRAVIAHLRNDLPGTREQQDAMLKQLQIDGHVVLMKDDRGYADKNPTWQAGGVHMAGVDPRVYAFRTNAQGQVIKGK